MQLKHPYPGSVDFNKILLGTGVPGTRCTGGTTSFLSCVENALQRGGDLPAQRVIICCASHRKKQKKKEKKARHKEKPTSVLERLDRGSREGPIGSRLQNSH